MGGSVQLRTDDQRWRFLRLEEKKRTDPSPTRAQTATGAETAAGPAPRDPRVRLDARTRFGADLAAQWLKSKMDCAPIDPGLPTSRPAGEPFHEIPRSQLDSLLAKVDKGGDLSQLDQVDNFRQTLNPEQQEEYDRQLQALRDDPRIEFDYREGATRSAAEEDLARRGMLAATFGNPELLEQTLSNTSAEDGKLHVYVYPSTFPLEPFHPGNTGSAPGLATPDGGIAIAQDFMRDVVAKGDNPFVHEFGHLTQRPGEHDDTNDGYPADFPFSEQVQGELESPEFQQFLTDRFFGGVPQDGPVHTGHEGWPTLLNLYRQYPEQLAEANPEIYRSMADYVGYDPLTREETPPIQLNGSGSLDRSLPALQDSFADIAGDDQRIDQDDLRAALGDRSLSAETRAAAAYLLSSPSARAAADVGAGRGDVDGDISINDLRQLEHIVRNSGGYTGPTEGVRGEVDSRDEAQLVLQRYLALADTAAGRGERDLHVSDDDLRALLADPGVPEELKQAARYMLED